MANNPPKGYAAGDFLDQILANPSYASLLVTDISAGASSESTSFNSASGISQLQQQPLFPLDSGFADANNTGGFTVKTETEAMNMGNFYPGLEHLQSHAVSQSVPQVHQVQTDRAAMLDEILDYVKFLRLQVKVLSMSRLGGASVVAQLGADTPLQSVEGDSCESQSNQHVWERWSDAETEQQVAKLMEEDVGTAMQYLQSKSLCIMPVSLAALIYPTQQTDDQSVVTPEPTPPL